MQPKVSIIVPCWGVEKYLDRCVESLVNQTLQDIEIILVDDVSPDKVPEMCDDWANKDARIKVVHKPQNEGLGMACNTGIENATGEYIAFCDSDDWLDSSMYETMYNDAIIEKADVVYTGLKRVDEQGKVTPMIHISNRIIAKGRDKVDGVMLDMIASAPSDPIERHIAMSAKVAIYRKQLFSNFNIRFESERKVISEDLFFNLDILMHSNCIVVLPNRFYNYYVNTQSLTGKARIDRFDKTKEMRDLLLNRYTDQTLPKYFKLRVDRWFMGYNRTDIKIICKASNLTLLMKRQLIDTITKDPIWRVIGQEYPVNQMPMMHKLFFKLTLWRQITAIMILSKLK